MFLGHYATALVPYGMKGEDKEKKRPFWVLLFASQFLDLLMLVLVGLGIEGISPHNFFDSTYATMQTHMQVSHDLVPMALWTLGFAAVVYAFSKDRWLAVWCGVLVLFHEVCDMVVGFEHNLCGRGTAVIGWNMYHKAPVLGLIIESILCVVCIAVFVHFKKKSGKPVSKAVLFLLFAILVGGTVATIPLCHHPLSSYLP